MDSCINELIIQAIAERNLLSKFEDKQKNSVINTYCFLEIRLKK